MSAAGETAAKPDLRPTVEEVVAAARPMFESRGAQALLEWERVDAVLKDGWFADLGVALQKVAEDAGYDFTEFSNRDVNTFIAGLTVGLEFVLASAEQ